MRQLNERRSPASTAMRTLLIVLALALVPACDREDPELTGPSIRPLLTPQAVIVGADVAQLPFTPADINDAGHVVGGRFLWTPAGGVQDLGTLGGSNTFAAGINEAGQVVGSSDAPAGRHAFLWTPGQGMQDLGTLGGTLSHANAINDLGHVVGYSLTATGAMRAFLWSPGQGMRELGAVNSLFAITVAHDINNAGVIVGESRDAANPGPDPALRATIWAPGEPPRFLPSLENRYAYAVAVNEAGQVAGSMRVGATHAFLWTPGVGVTDLGTLAPLNSIAHDLNDAGQVVGESDANSGFSTHGFFWTAADGMEDLWVAAGIQRAFGINNRGQVIGGGFGTGGTVATLRFDATNRDPVANVGGPYQGTEGSPVVLALSGTDADGDALTYTWDLGDGTTGSGSEPPAGHTYADNGEYTVTLTVSDGRGLPNVAMTSATIANVSPTIPPGGLAGPASPVQLIDGSASAAIALAFTDPAGAHDRYAAEIDCGNGTTLAPDAITSPFTGTCTYTSAGLYTLRATVSDEDGGTSAPAIHQYVIVYDPDGSFATGGGFIALSGQRGRKAHFTFNVKFGSATSATPDGHAKFWIPGERVDFESSEIEMLIASGDRAQFWGTGSMNGAPARFRMTVLDGQPGSSADAFRIEIWNAAGTVLIYDTQPGAAQDAPVTTMIDGGNIRVHADR